MSRLGCDVVLGDIQAQNISCKSITVDDQSNPTIPTEITIDTVNANTGNFDVINVTTLNVTDPDNPTVPTDINVNSITATEKLYVSNNAMLINNTLINTDTSLTDTSLLGNSGSATVGQYLNDIYPDSTHSYTLEQLAAGDNGSQSLIFTSGGGYQDPLRNTIQSFDSYRNTVQSLWLNPLGGTVFVSDLKPVNQTMGAACYMIKPNYACSTFICTIRLLANDESGGNPDIDQDADQDLVWCVNPGFKIIVYIDSDFNGSAEEYDNSNGLVPNYFNGRQDASSIQVFFNDIEVNPLNF
jgi:hypothetical protein